MPAFGKYFISAISKYGMGILKCALRVPPAVTAPARRQGLPEKAVWVSGTVTVFGTLVLKQSASTWMRYVPRGKEPPELARECRGDILFDALYDYLEKDRVVTQKMSPDTTTAQRRHSIGEPFTWLNLCSNNSLFYQSDGN